MNSFHRICRTYWTDNNLRATFLHPNGKNHRTARGEAYVSSRGNVYVAQYAAPNWLTEDGVEVVVADRQGDVIAAFEIKDVSTDGNAIQLNP